MEYIHQYNNIYTGQPVAWCLSDHESSDVIEAFISSIKARSPHTIVNVMMTDDGNSDVLYEEGLLNNFR